VMNDALMKNYEKTFMKEVVVIHAPFEEAPHTVAFVEVPAHLCDEEMCEIAFKKTNTIEEVWWKNEGVTYVGPEKTCRSTSTGDYVLIGTRKYKCAFTGWELV
jgi:hypothetical protein